MPWRETVCDESKADQDLRMELQELLGLDPAAPVRPAVEATAATVELADELRREALRRRHTPVLKTRRVWPMLLAAGLPVALALGGMATWGTLQKRKADALAADIRAKEAEVQRLAKVSAEAAAQAQQATQALVRVKSGTKGGQKARELVLPMEGSASRTPLDTQTVSNPNR